jgi:hypothetical protein
LHNQTISKFPIKSGQEDDLQQPEITEDPPQTQLRTMGDQLPPRTRPRTMGEQATMTGESGQR